MILFQTAVHSATAKHIHTAVIYVSGQSVAFFMLWQYCIIKMFMSIKAQFNLIEKEKKYNEAPLSEIIIKLLQYCVLYVQVVLLHPGEASCHRSLVSTQANFDPLLGVFMLS